MEPRISSVQRVKETLGKSQRNYAELLSITAELVQAKESDITAKLNALTQLPTIPELAWTLSSMRREFGNFAQARKHFDRLYGVKANNWHTLVERVNVVETALVHLGLGLRQEL